MFAARPIPSRYVSLRLSPGVRALVVEQNEILVARSGQIYSVLGDVVLTGRSLAGKAVTEHAIRVRPRSSVIHPGFLYAFLSLPDYGYTQIVRTAYGTSVPSLSVTELGDIAVPMPLPGDRDIIGQGILRAIGLRDEANELEDQAQAILAKQLNAALDRAPSSAGVVAVA
jgi:type I restriction enzyme S subunit